jgi:hypothetical protein
MPDFVVAGFPKAGTTTLAAHLMAHPGVWIPPQKELEFFDVQYARGLDWYEAQLAAAPATAVVGEASPAYLVRGEAVERMARTLPHAKVIAIVRNPVDRAFSHYRFREAWEPQSESFETAVHSEMAGDPTSVGLLSWGRYVEHLEALSLLVDRTRIQVVLLDDLVADPAGVLAQLFRFLDVDEQAHMPHTADVQNRAFRFRSVRLWHFMMSHGLWERLPLRLGFALDRLNRVALPPATMGADIRGELVDYYAPHNGRLASWLGRDLSGWTA